MSDSAAETHIEDIVLNDDTMKFVQHTEADFSAECTEIVGSGSVEDGQRNGSYFSGKLLNGIDKHCNQETPTKVVSETNDEVGAGNNDPNAAHAVSSSAQVSVDEVVGKSKVATHEQVGDGREADFPSPPHSPEIITRYRDNRDDNGEHHHQQQEHQQQQMVRRTASNDEAQRELDLHFEEVEYMPAFIPPDAGTPAAAALAANAAIRVSKMQKGLHKLHVKKPSMNALNIVKRLKKSANRRFTTNFKGKVIDGVHELYTLTAGMMLGIRCSIGRFTTHNTGDLALEDFSHVDKLTFPPKGCNSPDNMTPSHSLAHTFKFKSYSLKVFRRLRDFFGIDNAEYMNSVCGNYNYLEFISNSKSGQFFFYSHDGKYMIKTQTKEENKFMKKILPHYYKYVSEHPHTMLVRTLGMHRVKMYHLRRKVHFVIMSSVFDTPEKIHTIYDLKGSLVGRKATDKERAKGGVLKDQDLLDDGVKIKLGYKKQDFIDQLEKDANFLADLNIMDYSLLFGIHDRQQRAPAPPQTTTLVLSPNTAAGAGGGGTSNRPKTLLHQHSHSQTPFRRAGGGSVDIFEVLDTSEVEKEGEKEGESQQPLSWTERIGRRFSYSGSPHHSDNDEQGPSGGYGGGVNKERSASEIMSNTHAPSTPYRRDRAYSTGSDTFPTSPRTVPILASLKSPTGAVAGAGTMIGTAASAASSEDTPIRAIRFRPASVKLDGKRHQQQQQQQHHQQQQQQPYPQPRGLLTPSRSPSNASGSPIITPKSLGADVLAELSPPESISTNGDCDGDDDGDYDENEEGDVLEDLPELEEEEDVEEEHDDEGDSVDDDTPKEHRLSGTMENSKVGGGIGGMLRRWSATATTITRARGNSNSNSTSNGNGNGKTKKGGSSNSSNRRRLESEDKGKGVVGKEGGLMRDLFRTRGGGGGGGGGGGLFSSCYSYDSVSPPIPSSEEQEEEEEDNTATAAVASKEGRGGGGGGGGVDLVTEEGATEDVVVFGPGQTKFHPWTRRRDNGINSRLADGSRGSEIYYVGIIDILQRYNLRKQTETVFKSLTEDSTQISSVNSKRYAKRFVEFVSENTI